MPGGITNKQASYLAKLQRAAGERYSGSGLTSWEASLEIDRVKQQLATRRRLALEPDGSEQRRTVDRQAAVADGGHPRASA